jgi:GDP-4-dehydro-6-deoxy-D-mannose reductase
MMKVVLITGANGALGRATVAYFRKMPKYNVIATSRRGNQRDELELDIEDTNRLADVIRDTKPDLVIHLAATFVNDFGKAYAVNVESTRQLLELIQKYEYGIRVLLIGSAAEYGIVQPEENPISEDHMLRPVSIYGLTKSFQTMLVGVYANRGVDVLIARPFNLYGPGISEMLFIGHLQKQIDEVLAGQKSNINIGSLKSIRDYVSTDEAAAQIYAIANKGKTGRVYHVASGEPITMKQMLNRYLENYNINLSIVHEARYHSNKTGYDVPEIYANIDRTLELMRTFKGCSHA